MGNQTKTGYQNPVPNTYCLECFVSQKYIIAILSFASYLIAKSASYLIF